MGAKPNLHLQRGALIPGGTDGLCDSPLEEDLDSNRRSRSRDTHHPHPTEPFWSEYGHGLPPPSPVGKVGLFASCEWPPSARNAAFGIIAVNRRLRSPFACG